MALQWLAGKVGNMFGKKDEEDLVDDGFSLDALDEPIKPIDTDDTSIDDDQWYPEESHFSTIDEYVQNHQDDPSFEKDFIRFRPGLQHLKSLGFGLPLAYRLLEIAAHVDPNGQFDYFEEIERLCKKSPEEIKEVEALWSDWMKTKIKKHEEIIVPLAWIWLQTRYPLWYLLAYVDRLKLIHDDSKKVVVQLAFDLRDVQVDEWYEKWCGELWADVHNDKATAELEDDDDFDDDNYEPLSDAINEGTYDDSILARQANVEDDTEATSDSDDESVDARLDAQGDFYGSDEYFQAIRSDRPNVALHEALMRHRGQGYQNELRAEDARAAQQPTVEDDTEDEMQDIVDGNAVAPAGITDTDATSVDSGLPDYEEEPDYPGNPAWPSLPSSFTPTALGYSPTSPAYGITSAQRYSPTSPAYGVTSAPRSSAYSPHVASPARQNWDSGSDSDVPLANVNPRPSRPSRFDIGPDGTFVPGHRRSKAQRWIRSPGGTVTTARTPPRTPIRSPTKSPHTPPRTPGKSIWDQYIEARASGRNSTYVNASTSPRTSMSPRTSPLRSTYIDAATSPRTPRTPLGPNTTFEDFMTRNRPRSTKRPFKVQKVQKVDPLRYQNRLTHPRRLPNTPTKSHLPPSPRRGKKGKASCPTCGRGFREVKKKRKEREVGTPTPARIEKKPVKKSETPVASPRGPRRSGREVRKPARFS